MTFKTTIISAATALAIAAGTIAVPATASASPFAALQTTTIETGAAGVEEVKRRRIRHGRRGYRGVNPGAAAAAIGVGALIVGAAIAANARPRCRVVRVERWSRRHQAYVIRRQEVCD